MQLHSSTPDYLAKVREHTTPYTTIVEGIKLIIHPEVMSPAYDMAPATFLQDIENVAGKTILDMGTGCGVLAVHAKHRGATNVDGADINPAAARNAEANFKMHNVMGTVYGSDLFDQIPEETKYDEIWFNAPYHSGEAHDDLELGVTDPNYHSLDSFLRIANQYLTEKGTVRIGFSNTGDTSHLHEQIRRNQWRMEKRHSRPIDDWVALHYELKKWEFETPKQEWMYEDDREFVEWAEAKLSGKQVLKVGQGLGYVENMIEQIGGEVTTIGPSDYNGTHLPFETRQFDVVLGAYMLHHAEHRDAVLKEMMRVGSAVLLAEETYRNPAEWARLVLNDWNTNRHAKQKVTIRPLNYYRAGELSEHFLNTGWSVQRDRQKRTNGVERLWLYANDESID